jgi:hypothetical protein
MDLYHGEICCLSGMRMPSVPGCMWDSRVHECISLTSVIESVMVEHTY